MSSSTSSAAAASTPIPTLESIGRTTPPDWAIKQRYLIDLMKRGAVTFADRVTRPDGTLLWRTKWTSMDGTDNAYESFLSFPLFYLLGGGEHVHQLARKEWDAITWQFENFGTVDREFVTGFDWFHHSESYTYIYYLGMAAPNHFVGRTRALRYAAMYTGEDPQAPNWDAEKKMIRGPLNGSHGPRSTTTRQDWDYHRPILSEYLAPYEDIVGADSSDPMFTVDWTDDAVFARVLDQINERMTRGDVPLNLGAAGLITNAYLHTGERKYKDWVLNYLRAWIERRDANGGIMPDNIGPSGRIGELMNGKWWGGYYGWRWPHGARNIIEPTFVAGSCAMLLTGGDDSWLDLCRSQLDLLWSLRQEEDGVVKVPARHGDRGWFDFQPPNPMAYIYLYYLSQSGQDKARLDEVFPDRAGFTQISPDWGAYKAGVCPPQAWFAYTEGDNPGFPEDIIASTYDTVCRSLDRLDSDHTNPEERGCEHFHDLNPVLPEGLIQMCMGTPGPLYNGGLLHAHVRYFNPRKRRPGLPEHVAALVEKVGADSLCITLVNTDPMEAQTVLLQSGSFAEHHFTAARLEVEGGPKGQTLKTNSRHLLVRLGPSARARLHLDIKRFVHQPTYDFPPFEGITPES